MDPFVIKVSYLSFSEFHTVLSVPWGLVITCWERADLFALSHCVFVTHHMVSRVRCDT